MTRFPILLTAAFLSAGCARQIDAPVRAQPAVSSAAVAAFVRAAQPKAPIPEVRRDILLIEDRPSINTKKIDRVDPEPIKDLRGQAPRWNWTDTDFVPDSDLRTNTQYLYCEPGGKAYRVKLIGLPYMTSFRQIKKYSWIPIDPDCTWRELEWVFGDCRFKPIPKTYPYTADGLPLTRDNAAPGSTAVVKQAGL